MSRKTVAWHRSRGRPQQGPHSRSPSFPIRQSSGGVSRIVLLWSLCLAHQATRVSASSSAEVSFTAWQPQAASQAEVFRGSSSSDDEGTDLESSSEDEPPLPFVLVPNASASGEVHPDDLSSDNEDEEQWVQDESKTTKHEDEQQNGSQEKASEWLQDDDGTAEMTALKQNEDPPPQALAQLEHINGVEVEGVEPDEELTEEEDVPQILLPQQHVNNTEEGIVSDVEVDEEAAVEAPEVSLLAQHVGNAEEESDESDVAEEDDGVTQVLLPAELINDVDDSDREGYEEEGEMLPVSDHVEPARPPSNLQMKEEQTSTSHVAPIRRTTAPVSPAPFKVAQEVQSEDEASDWMDDEKAATDDEDSDIEMTVHATAVARDADSVTTGDTTITASADSGKPDESEPKGVPSPVTTSPSRQQPWGQKPKRRYKTPSEVGSSSQPLKTLKKLQQMLDETDYMTAAPGSRGDDITREIPVASSSDETVWFDQETLVSEYDHSGAEPVGASSDASVGKDNTSEGEKLWTSKDRMKYKKQQQRIRRAKQEQIRLEQQLRSPPLHPNSSDDDAADGDTDDGLGYTLPNLPVYFSDAEGTTDLTDVEQVSASQQLVHEQSIFQPPPPPFEQRGPYQYPPPGYNPYGIPPPPDQNRGQPMPPYMGYPPNPYMPYPPYGPYGPQQQHMYASQYAAAWAAAAASAGTSPYGVGRSPNRPYPPPQTSTVGIQRKPDGTQGSNALHETKPVISKASYEATPSTSTLVDGPVPLATGLPADASNKLAFMTSSVPPPSMVGTNSRLNFDSLQKMSILAITISLLCYSAVSPHTLPTAEYNMKFFENLKIVSLSMIPPLLTFISVFDPNESDVNNAVNAFYTAFTVGYGLAFLLQLVFTTVIRLGVFLWFEPNIFKLTPQVPALVLPWVLRDKRYRPKRITLFAADFVTSCVAGPIIEEYVKLKILQLSVRLPRNFRWTTKVSTKNKKRKRKVAEVIPRNPGEPEVTNINAYVSQMMAASIGIKLCDSLRRILMYTKDRNEHKGFYAVCRGIFPIHELCGTMTALGLAKRDVLGWEMPLWKLLAPAVVVHGMANFRGMKPIFKWNSATPWSEMQLSPWNAGNDETFAQLANKALPKLMWLVILGRVLGYCIKNYYLIRRQAVKRTTTYAGKRAAFSAELAAAEMLKKTSKDK